jgi:hypothetical protein
MSACEGCGLPLGESDAFCGNCGQGVGAPAVSPPAAENPSGLPDMSPWPVTVTDTSTLPHPDGEPRPGDPVLAGAALGQATPNSTYIGQRLLYEKVPEATFDPLTNTRFLLHLGKQALMFFVIYLLGAILSVTLFALLGIAGMGTAVVGIWATCAWVFFLVLVCAFLFLPVTALLSEWKFLVDDKGAAGPVAFDHISYVLRRRQTPLESVQVRRLRLPGGETRDYLELRRGIFTGFISCFPQGADLYVGWTFWLSLPPWRWFVMALARIWQNVTQRGTDLYLTLRYESAKAMREAMHSAAREGLDVAAGQISPQGQGITSTIPVVTTDVTM